MRRDSVIVALASWPSPPRSSARPVIAQRTSREVGGLADSIARDAAPGLAAIRAVRGESGPFRSS